MSVVAGFGLALAWLLSVVLNGLSLVILVNALLSWVQPDPNNPIVRSLERISDMVCDPIRRLLPTVVGNIDLAPLIAMLAFQFLRIWLVPVLSGGRLM